MTAITTQLDDYSAFYDAKMTKRHQKTDDSVQINVFVASCHVIFTRWSHRRPRSSIQRHISEFSVIYVFCARACLKNGFVSESYFLHVRFFPAWARFPLHSARSSRVFPDGRFRLCEHCQLNEWFLREVRMHATRMCVRLLGLVTLLPAACHVVCWLVRDFVIDWEIGLLAGVRLRNWLRNYQWTMAKKCAHIFLRLLSCAGFTCNRRLVSKFH
jgi:hypothetical protein